MHCITLQCSICINAAFCTCCPCHLTIYSARSTGRGVRGGTWLEGGIWKINLVSTHCNESKSEVKEPISTNKEYSVKIGNWPSFAVHSWHFPCVPIKFIKPARSVGFSQIKKIPYQAPPTQLGPRKCTFWKNAFLRPKYQC